MKRFLSLVLVAVFIFALAGCGAEKSKKNILLNYFK